MGQPSHSSTQLVDGNLVHGSDLVYNIFFRSCTILNMRNPTNNIKLIGTFVDRDAFYRQHLVWATSCTMEMGKVTKKVNELRILKKESKM